MQIHQIILYLYLDGSHVNLQSKALQYTFILQVSFLKAVRRKILVEQTTFPNLSPTGYQKESLEMKAMSRGVSLYSSNSFSSNETEKHKWKIEPTSQRINHSRAVCRWPRKIVVKRNIFIFLSGKQTGSRFLVVSLGGTLLNFLLSGYDSWIYSILHFVYLLECFNTVILSLKGVLPQRHFVYSYAI